MNPFKKSLLILAWTMIVLFMISDKLMFLEQNYMMSHQNELERIETVQTDDGVVNNYTYANTPYTVAYMIFFFMYVGIPAIATPVLAVRYFRQHKKKKKSFGKSFLIPLFFVALTFLLQSKNLYEAVGWEQTFGFYVVSIYSGIVFIITALILGAFKLKK